MALANITGHYTWAGHTAFMPMWAAQIAGSILAESDHIAAQAPIRREIERLRFLRDALAGRIASCPVSELAGAMDALNPVGQALHVQEALLAGLAAPVPMPKMNIQTLDDVGGALVTLTYDDSDPGQIALATEFRANHAEVA